MDSIDKDKEACKVRAEDWVNSSTEELPEEANEVQEEICESLVEEVIVEQENDNYITCFDEDCMEESIVYVFEEPVIEFDLNDSHYIIQEPVTYEMEETEPAEVDTVNSESSRDFHKIDSNPGSPDEEIVVSEENVVQETLKVEVSEEIVNSSSDNESVNKCVSDLPTSDISLKTCNFNENSESVDNILLNNDVLNKSNKEIHELSETSEVQIPVQINSLYGDDPITSIIIESIPEVKHELRTPEIISTSEIDKLQLEMSPVRTSSVTTVTSLRTPPNMLPSVLSKSKFSPLKRSVIASSELNSPVENKSPLSDSNSSLALRTCVLGKDQIKKRLQSFSLLKQGIQPIPIKKIINPKQPKVHMQMGEVYDETGRKLDEKFIVKKPPKQGPTPTEKARQVIDEIEQIKKEEAAIYEQTLTFMKNSMRDAYKKKSRTRGKDRRRSPIKKVKKYDKDNSKNRNRRSSESDKFHKSPENKIDKKKDKCMEIEKRRDNEMPKNWTEIKQKNINFAKISQIKQKTFKFSERKPFFKNSKRGKKFIEEEKTIMRKEDFVQPQLMFEFPSLLRESLQAISIKGKIKYYPSECIRFTEKFPTISYCENPKNSTNFYRNRKQILNEISDERAKIMTNIIENKIRLIDSGKFISGVWYSKQYLTKSKNETEPVKSYGLSVLSEMYDDEQEEILEIGESKKNKEKNILSKKRKHKSTSRSRSPSKENLREDEEKKDLKSKNLKNLDTSIVKSKTILEENILDIDSFKEKHEDLELENETPNTEEYRSNWESDEDILNEIMPENDCSTYNESCKSWNLEEIINKYEDKGKLDKERRKDRNKDILELNERSRKHFEEDKRSLPHFSEERMKSDLKSNIRNSENFEYCQRTEEKLDLSCNYEKSEMSDFRTNSEDRIDFNYKSSLNLKRSEENEKMQKHLESDYKKSQNFRNESTERYESGRSRRISEYDRHKKISDDLKEEETKSRRSVEHDKRKDDKFRHSSQENDSKRSKRFNCDEIIHNSDRDNKKLKENQRDSFEKSRKFEHEEQSNYSLKQEEELNNIHISRHKDNKTGGKNYRRRDFEFENRSLTPDRKKTETKEKNKLNNDDTEDSLSLKSDKRKFEEEAAKLDSIQLNLNLNYQKSQWSSDEECVEKSEDKRSHHFEEDLQFLGKKTEHKNQWEQDLEIEPENYRKINRYENLLDSDFVSLKELERNRKITEEIKERRNKSKEEEYSRKNIKKKSKAEKKKIDEKEKSKKIKKRNKEKKLKNKFKKDKTPKVKITYSDLEDSYDEDFRTAKQKEQDLLFTSDSNKKYAAKIKIDYSDFDMSLIESKDKYEKKIEEMSQKTPEILEVTSDILQKDLEFSKNIDLNPVTSISKIERKVNIDLSEIIIEQKSYNVEMIKYSPKLEEKVENLQKFQEMIIGKNKVLDENAEQKLKNVIPESEIKTKDEEIAPIILKNDTKSVAMAINLSEITPVAPPVLPIPKPIDLPVTPDPNKLVSEYEEFMKAVCSDEPKSEPTQEENREVKEIEQKEFFEKVLDTSKEDESDTSSEESSSEEVSEEHSDSDSNSELSPDSARNKMLETVANIKIEKFTDSENESRDSERSNKRKRSDYDSNSETETFDNIIVKSERDNSKKTSNTNLENKYDNIIDWEKTCITNKKINYSDFDIESKNAYDTNSKITDISETIHSFVLPENIPLPSENQISVQDIPTPDIITQINRSPSEIMSASESVLTSPTKKSRSFIPIKLLTAETRKQANETAQLVDRTSSFCKFTPVDVITQIEDVTNLKNSNNTFQSDSENILTIVSSDTIDELEQNASRKRQSQWNINITPAKKPMLQNMLLGDVDSDEDFTDKFIKSDKKQEPTKKSDEFKEKEKSSELEKEVEKIESSVHEDKKEDKKSTGTETRKQKEDLDEKSRRNDKSRDKSRYSVDRHLKEEHKPSRRSLTPPKLDRRSFRRSSRERTEKYDKNDRNDRRDKPKDNLDRKNDRIRDRSREHSRDRSVREHQRERDKRRLTDRRLPDRKQPITRARSPRLNYSRERELSRSRFRDRSKDRQNKYKEPERDRERDRSRERIRERERSRDRDHREKDDRRNYRRDRFSRSPSSSRKDFRQSSENISAHHRMDDTDFSTTNMDIVHSPLNNSPLDGFKRSLADSTISDSELVTQLNTPDESNEPSPSYNNLHSQHYYPSVQEIVPESQQSPSSPKRISLDDRINLVLGIEKEPPKPIDTVCTRGPYMNTQQNYHDPYSYSRSEYDMYSTQQPEGYVPNSYSSQYQPQYYQNQLNTDNNVKVVQVGNVIQVVPTEQPPQQSTSTHAPKANEVPPKVVQVGNMLQIVPVTIIDSAIVASPVSTVAPSMAGTDKIVVPKPTDQLVLERRAEKEKRRQEREQRRKEKEKKRKDKEKRRQLKIKIKTENMIKRALLLETGEGDIDITNIDTEPLVETNDNNNLPVSWPPSSVLSTVSLPKPPGKGILVTHGFREKEDSTLDDSIENKKVVKFADGICPGEGTSPSAGEELPSPPPPPRKLPKEKRYKKLKNKNKKKIKVKIIRTQQQAAEEDDSSEDNLPPPPPPPGSPPPHLWPPRVKQPPINNIHSSLPGSVFPPAYPAPQQVMYPPAYQPIAAPGQSVPVVVGHAPPPPPPQAQRHHQSVIPVLQTGPPPHGSIASSFHH